MSEILTTIANLALTLFTICSLVSVGISLTVREIVEPLHNACLLALILVGKHAVTMNQKRPKYHSPPGVRQRAKELRS